MLCTTETFAVGVNMPSRAIVFNWSDENEFQKYDGVEQRDIRVADGLLCYLCMKLRQRSMVWL